MIGTNEDLEKFRDWNEKMREEYKRRLRTEQDYAYRHKNTQNLQKYLEKLEQWKIDNKDKYLRRIRDHVSERITRDPAKYCAIRKIISIRKTSKSEDELRFELDVLLHAVRYLRCHIVTRFGAKPVTAWDKDKIVFKLKSKLNRRMKHAKRPSLPEMQY